MKRSTNLQNESAGFGVVGIIMILCGIIVLGFIIHLVTHADPKTSHQTLTGSTTSNGNSSASPSSGLYAVLSPATVPPKVAECSQQVAYSANGDSGPIQCSNGDLNAVEWNSLAALEPTVMTLGYGATAAQVQAALCSDVRTNVSNPIEETVYQITSLYYGWSFTSNPSIVITNGTCVNVDD